MELKKTNESKNRNYDMQGNLTNYNENESFSLVDGDGNEIGNVSISVDNYSNGSASVNLCGFQTLEDGEAKIKALLGIE